MELLKCIIYLIVSGIIIFFIGRIFPRTLLKENNFPFKPYKFEKNGKIYEIFKIKKWKTKLPDASVIIYKIFPNFMPIKRIKKRNKNTLNTLIKESCVAETTHFLAAITGFACVKIWKGLGGWVVSLFYLILHIPFIMIQRYNRPRLSKALLNIYCSD